MSKSLSQKVFHSKSYRCYLPIALGVRYFFGAPYRSILGPLLFNIFCVTCFFCTRHGYCEQC